MESTALVTREEAKTACNIRDNNDQFDTVIDHLILVATQQLERVTGRFFTQQQVTEYFATKQTYEDRFDLSGLSETGVSTHVRPSTIRLQGLNVAEAGFDLRYDYMREWGADSVVSPKDYILDRETGNVRLLFGTRASERALRVTYTAGYEKEDNSLSASIPAPLKEACLLQVIYLRARRRPDNVGLTGDRSTGKGDSFVQTMAWGAKQGVTPEALGLIAHLKRPVVGRH